MVKSKFVVIAASAALVAMLGLSACGGQAASSSSSGAAASDAAASSSAAASSTAASSSSASAEDATISWQGALVDGTLVDYISSDDGANGGLVLTKDENTEPKRWLGAMTSGENGKMTITDDTTKEAINFTLGKTTEDGAMLIEVEGYGKGALVPMTANDWKMVAEAEKISDKFNNVVNWVGSFEDGSLVAYMDTEKGDEAALAIVSASTPDMKVWAGKVTTSGNDKLTITDDTTKEDITITATKGKDDGTLNIENDTYGKGVLVQMTADDWKKLEEAVKSEPAK